MKISEKGLKLVQHFEGCLKPVPHLSGHFSAYKCPADVWTIGYGHTNHHGRQFNSGSVWTQAECDAELRSDMAHFEAIVERLVKVDLKPHQFDALVSFTFNVGEGRPASKGKKEIPGLSTSTLLRKLNGRDFVGASEQFSRWTHGGGRVLPGLVRRRAAESLLFQGIADENFDGKPDQLIHIATEEPVPQQVDPPVEKSITESTIAKGTVVVGGTAAAGASTTLWDVISSVPQSIFDFFLKMVEKPNFMLFLVCGSGAGYVLYRRFIMKKNEGV
jgi:lysozyme